MNQKELMKTFMMISKLKKPFGLHGFCKKEFSASRVKRAKVLKVLTGTNLWLWAAEREYGF